jgi:hypothetical protein
MGASLRDRVLALRAKPYGLGGSRFARLALGRKDYATEVLV